MLNALAVVIAMHEKLGRLVEHVEHSVLVSSFHVLSAGCPIVHPRSNWMYSGPGQSLGS